MGIFDELFALMRRFIGSWLVVSKDGGMVHEGFFFIIGVFLMHFYSVFVSRTQIVNPVGMWIIKFSKFFGEDFNRNILEL